MSLRKFNLPILLMVLALVGGCGFEDKVASPPVGADAPIVVDKCVSEALQAPSLDLAAGSGLAQGGASLVGVGSAYLTVTVPKGAAVRQAFLYWAGRSTASAAGDDTISLGGVAVAGQLIGGPTWFYEHNGCYYLSAYRADITDLELVGPGTNTLCVSQFDFMDQPSDENGGASVVVIFDDGSSSEIALRDGLDMAYYGYEVAFNQTEQQVFPVSPAAVDRVADLVVLAGNAGENRPDRILVTTAAGEQIFDDPMGGFEGPQWDSLVLPVYVPAGITSITVELVSPSSCDTPGASLGWVCAALSVPVPIVETCDWAVSGTVYIDTDRDGQQDASETGLPGVVVDLTGGDYLQSAVTDTCGRYLFAEACTGSWTVAVDLRAHPDAFNADLAAYFSSTSPLTRVVTVGPDAPDNDFGFVPDADRILADLADGDITTDGFTRETWRGFFRCAMHYDHVRNAAVEKPGRSDHDGGIRHEDSPGHRLGDSCACNEGDLLYDADALRALLATVEGLFLPVPYQFSDGQELNEAYRLISRNVRSVEDRVRQELLVTELNYLVGRGAVDQPDLVASIAAWSESLLILDATEVAKSVDKGRATGDLSQVLMILEAVNTGGGGGVDE